MDRRALIELLDLNTFEFNRDFTRRGGGAVRDEDGLLLYAGAHPLPVLLNGAARTGPGLAPREAAARAIEFFRERGRGFTFWACLHADADLEPALAEAGLRAFGEDSPGMVLEHPLDDARAPAGVEIRRVRDAAGVRDVASVSAEAYATYGMPLDVAPAVFARPGTILAPHVAAFVAYAKDAAPIATAFTMVTHGVAGIYWVGTVPAARGRGLAEVVTRAAVNAGFDLGGRIAGLTASPMGAPVYRRMGFVEVTRYREYVKFSPD